LVFFISQNITVNLLQQNLVEQFALDTQSFFPPNELALYTPNSLSIEEAIELFNVSLNFNMITRFIVITFITLIISAMLSMRQIFRINPDLLLKRGKIG